MTTITRRNFTLATLAGIGALTAPALVRQARAAASAVRLGFSYATPSTLVIKEKGWLEEEFGAKGIAVEWTLSRGSNQTLEFLRSGAIDFGASAGSAALLGHANGAPNQVISWLSRGESTTLLALPDSGIKTLQDLRGKKVAATRATEPYLFLLRALAKEGIPATEVEVVPLQHPEGRLALESGQVDAWAALDPDFAITEITRGSVPIYRDLSLITGGVLNVHKDFATENPDLVTAVLKANVRAVDYIKANPAEALALYAAAGKLEQPVAERSFNRNVLDQFAITDADVANLIAAGEALRDTGSIPAGTDLAAATNSLLAGSYITQVLAAG
ncbi:aliphatic sulfonate ABC transporter substrate-binding protein [Pseudogemmobacter blasticus]|nr:aliphatic sulfonate ABC transporter substrate-binding protein [Fuscovulum blasticum]